jgi:hypothetical protein
VVLGISAAGEPVVFAYGTFTLSGVPFQKTSANNRPCSLPRFTAVSVAGPATPFRQRLLAWHRNRFGLFPFRSPLLRESQLLSFPPGTEMFHFPGFASRDYGFIPGCTDITPHGFPHSGIAGSKLVCSSPALIAAYHALHRLQLPRHPPCALSSLR